MISKKALRKVLAAQSTEELLRVGEQNHLFTDGKIDLSGETIPLRYQGIDLSIFRFEGANLTGSRFVNCRGVDAIFTGSKLDNVRFSMERGGKASMQGASFRRCSMRGAFFSAATLNLSSTCFVESDIRDTKFMLGNLVEADFSGSHLKNVEFRSAKLDGANFQGALLERVCLEKASLNRADFRNAQFNEMEFWGEPDFTGATVPDSLLYQSGIVTCPLERIDNVLKSDEFDEEALLQIGRLRDRVKSFAADAPEAMLIATEYEDLISFDLFVQLLKRLKNMDI